MNAPDDLRETVRMMDCYAQSAFTEIDLLASLALRRLEAPEGIASIRWIGDVFEAIRRRAQETENDINSAAESVGANYINAAARRRNAALFAAKHETQKGNTP
jgi:hypothetical protein